MEPSSNFGRELLQVRHHYRIYSIAITHLSNSTRVAIHHPDTLSAMNGANAWLRHQIETFSASLAICAENSPVTGEFPAQRPLTRSFDVFFDLHLYQRLSKKRWGWWFETPSRQLWRHCNGICPVLVAFGKLVQFLCLNAYFIDVCFAVNLNNSLVKNYYHSSPSLRPWRSSLNYGIFALCAIR